MKTKEAVKFFATTAFLVACFLASMGSYAQEEVSSPETVKKMEKKWSQFSEEKKEKYRLLYRRWNAKNSKEQKNLISRFKEFKSMTLTEKKQVIAAYKAFKKLSPASRKVLIARYKQYKSIPEDVRRQRLADIKKMRKKKSASGSILDEGIANQATPQAGDCKGQECLQLQQGMQPGLKVGQQGQDGVQPGPNQVPSGTKSGVMPQAPAAKPKP